MADAIAAGAALLMGEASEGPVVIARSLEWTADERNAAAGLRPVAKELFR